MGFVVYDPFSREIHREGRYLGVTTNNCAEYQALIAALKYCSDHLQKNAVTVYSDSELVVRQLNGMYRVRNPGLKSLHREADRLVQLLDASLKHVGRDKNRVADGIVNQTLDSMTDISLSGQDIRLNH